MAIHIGVEFGQHHLVLLVELVLHKVHLHQFIHGGMELYIEVHHVDLEVHGLEVRNFRTWMFDHPCPKLLHFLVEHSPYKWKPLLIFTLLLDHPHHYFLEASLNQVLAS